MLKKILPALLIVTCLLSCSSPDTLAPTAAVDGMINAMKSGDFEKTKKFISRNDVAMLEAGERFMSSIDPDGIKKMKEKMAADFREKAKSISYKLQHEKINGDKATVEAEVTGNGKAGSHTFNLVKEEGDWKIALSESRDMFNSMKGDMGRDKPTLEGGLEKLKSMPPDSLKKMLDSMKSKMKIN
ncbi:MAG TPA: DUF4878 domain-containing protein [Ferruginibacter sp.]|nr:DUF4878 domain-containing protein [Ferruginibacter sp.]